MPKATQDQSTLLSDYDQKRYVMQERLKDLRIGSRILLMMLLVVAAVFVGCFVYFHQELYLYLASVCFWVSGIIVCLALTFFTCLFAWNIIFNEWQENAKKVVEDLKRDRIFMEQLQIHDRPSYNQAFRHYRK